MKEAKIRCYSCSQLSLNIICQRYQEYLLIPSIGTHKIRTLNVISFYKYAGLETLLHTKHKPEGCRIHKALAKITMKPFMEEFVEADDREVYIIGVDKYVKSGYAHVAVLTRAMETKYSIPLHSALMAQSRANYSGKGL